MKKRAKHEKDDEINNLRQQQPYLSGAYIRSFVKQLTSSRSMMREKTSTVEREEEEEIISQQQQQQQQQQIPQQHKKQVRRRLQTRKPYQEKLLNMAEARREIVTALKLHRAAMKQANENQQIESAATSDFQTDQQKSRRNPRIYASNAVADNNVVCPSPCFCSWPPPPSSAAAFLQENIDFALPSQPLGLNLNLQDFITGSSTSSIYSPSPPPPPPPAAAAAVERFEFLNCVEMINNGEDHDQREEEMVSSPFDDVMEFPAWLNANESCLHHVDDFCAQDFLQNPVLPCMDIEEIEGMDGDWLA